MPPAENLEFCSRLPADAVDTPSGADSGSHDRSDAGEADTPKPPHSQALESLKSRRAGQSPAMLNIVSPPKQRSLASASGVSFARVVFAAVQYSVSDGGGGDGAGGRSTTATTMRDSFFGLHAKPAIKPAPFPDREVGLRLVRLYFEHANPQMPILHRGEFTSVLNRAYESGGRDLAPRELYLLNMVFAIGSGVIVGEPVKTEPSDEAEMTAQHGKKRSQPEEYHASAIVHLESCLSFSAGGLEVLQAVLLLANFALLRPVPPGLW